MKSLHLRGHISRPALALHEANKNKTLTRPSHIVRKVAHGRGPVVAGELK